MKKLVKHNDVMQETLEAYCSCSCLVLCQDLVQVKMRNFSPF